MAQKFPHFAELEPGLQCSIFSFLADAPYEAKVNDNQPQSFLTHILPLVSQQCRTYSEMDVLWKPALIRQARNEPRLWRALFYQILGEEQPEEMTMAASSEKETNDKDDNDQSPKQAPLPSWQEMEELVQRARAWDDYPSDKAMYRYLFRSKVRFVGPVFMMGGPVTMGETYGLHFFEPRYRLLIAQVMQGQRVEPESGRVVSEALFVHANRAMTPRAPAALVRVEYCRIYPDGRADVELCPVAHVWLQRVWVRENSGNLHYAQALRMGQEATERMNETSQRESYIMAISDFLRPH